MTWFVKRICCELFYSNALTPSRSLHPMTSGAISVHPMEHPIAQCTSKFLAKSKFVTKAMTNEMMPRYPPSLRADRRYHTVMIESAELTSIKGPQIGSWIVHLIMWPPMYSPTIILSRLAPSISVIAQAMNARKQATENKANCNTTSFTIDVRMKTHSTTDNVLPNIALMHFTLCQIEVWKANPSCPLSEIDCVSCGKLY